MKWVKRIADDISPAFGGFPTFVVDPDSLLDIPELREELHKRNVTIEQWSGTAEELPSWNRVHEDNKLVIQVSSDCPVHLIGEVVSEQVTIDISISKLFRKFDPEVARHVAKEYWDMLLSLQDREKPLRTKRESALVIARAIYGIDELYGSLHGWDSYVAGVAESGEAIPQIIVDELLGVSGDDKVMLLADMSAARLASRQTSAALHLAVSEPKASIRSSKKKAIIESVPELVRAFRNEKLLAPDLLALAYKYADAVRAGLGINDREACNKAFRTWLGKNYDLMLNSQNLQVLRLHRLIDQLDGECGSDRMAFFVVDAMGLEPWLEIDRVWRQRGIHSKTIERSAFAVIPTLTNLSRRAIFERALPPQFGKGIHGPSLERSLWTQRFPDGAYFSAGEYEAFRDALYQGKSRVALVDVSWDKRGHSIDPDTETIAEAASAWANKCAVAEAVKEALDQGYAVYLTADHGQIAGKGLGMPNSGSAIEDRSKRVLVFSSNATLNSHRDFGDTEFRPITVPNGQFPLFPAYGDSYDNKGVGSVSHGGYSIEEVIVPVVEVRK